MKKNTDQRKEKPFSVFLFTLTVFVTLCLFLTGIGCVMAFIAPETLRGIAHEPLWKWGVTFLVAHGFCAVAEFLFHRYMLHASFPFLSRLYKQHTLHHALTSVRLISVCDTRGKIFNRYPILVEKQFEASYFPWYSLGAFLLVSLVVTVPLQILLPRWPIIFGSVFAVTFSIMLYEIIHAMEHWSFETVWKPLVLHARWGKWWTSFYCFHLRHHADIMSNENISGFFGLPIADWMFGTYAPWPRAFVDGEIVPESEFKARPPRPRRLLRLLDRVFLEA